MLVIMVLLMLEDGGCCAGEPETKSTAPDGGGELDANKAGTILVVLVVLLDRGGGESDANVESMEAST